MAGQTASDSLPLATPFHEEGGGGGILGQLMENHSGCSNSFTTMGQLCTGGPLYLNPALSSIFLSSTTYNSSDSPFEESRSSPPSKKTLPLVESPPSSPSLPPADDAAQVVYVMEERCVPLEEMEVEELSSEPLTETSPPSATGTESLSPSASHHEESNCEPEYATGDSNEHSIENEAVNNLVNDNVNTSVDGDAESNSDNLSNSGDLSKSPAPSAGLDQADIKEIFNPNNDGSESVCSGPCSPPQGAVIMDAAPESNSNENENNTEDEQIRERDASEDPASISDKNGTNGAELVSDGDSHRLESEPDSPREQEETTDMDRQMNVEDEMGKAAAEIDDGNSSTGDRLSKELESNDGEAEIEVLELVDEEREDGEEVIVVDKSGIEQGEMNGVSNTDDNMDEQEVEEIVIESDRKVVDESTRVEELLPASEVVDVEDITDRDSCCSLKSDNSVVMTEDRSTGDGQPPQPNTVQSRTSPLKRNYNLRTRDNLDYNEKQLRGIFVKPKKRHRCSTKSQRKAITPESLPYRAKTTTPGNSPYRAKTTTPGSSPYRAKTTSPDTSPYRYNSLKEAIRCSKLEIPIKKLPSPFPSPKIPSRFQTMRLLIKKTPSPTSKQPLVPSPTSKKPLVPSPVHSIPVDPITPSNQSPRLTPAVLSRSFSPYSVPSGTPIQHSNKSTQTPTTSSRRNSSSSKSGQSARESSKPPSTPSNSRSPRRRRSARWSEERSGDRLAKNTCIFCGLPSNSRNLGYLYGPYQCSLPSTPSSPRPHRDQQKVWVHVSCTIWAPGVCLDLEGGDLRGLQTVVDECANQHCVVCNRPMATLSCHHHGCKAIYHYPCALDNDVQFIQDQFCIYCTRHKKEEEDKSSS